MLRERFTQQVTLERAERLPAALNLSGQTSDEAEYELLSKAFFAAVKTYEGAIRTHNALLQELEQPVVEAEKRLKEAVTNRERLLKEAEAGPARVTNDHYEFLRDQIRVLLSRDDLRLPRLVSALLKKFALPVHPAVVAAQDTERETGHTLVRAREAHSKMTREEEAKFRAQKEAQERSARAAQAELLSFCDRIAASSLDRAREYLLVIPERENQVCTLYLQAHPLQAGDLEDFNDFFARELGFDKLSLESRARFYGERYPWLIAGQMPDSDDLARVPQNLIEKFRRYKFREAIRIS